MKRKFQFLVMMLTCILLSINQVWAETLTENFSSSEATTNNYDCTSNLSTEDHRKDYDYTWSYGGNGTVWQNGVKLGSSSATGSVTSSNFISAVPSGASFTIKVYAARWNKDNGNITVTYNSESTSLAPTNSAITTTSSEYSVSAFSSSTNFDFVKVDGVNAITIASSANRILIDKVEVVYSGSTYTDN